MAKPMFDLIFHVNTLSTLGIVLDFNTKNITIDEAILQMRDINKLSNKFKIDRAWSVNNSMHHEPPSTLDASKCAVKILDIKYAKADLESVVQDNCSHLSLSDQNRLLEVLKTMKTSLTAHWVIGNPSLSFESKVGAKPYHSRAFPVPSIH